MAVLNRDERSELIRRGASRLRYPYLFVLVAVLFLVDLFLPDPVPLVDEIMLGSLAVLFGMWKERRRIDVEPVEKNVTPRDPTR